MKKSLQPDFSWMSLKTKINEEMGKHILNIFVFTNVIITASPQIKTFESNNTVAQFSVADNIINRLGEKSVDYYEIKVWNNLAQYVSKLQKGECVNITGAFSQEHYTSKEGKKKNKIVFTANLIERSFGNKSKNGNNEKKENDL